MSAIARLGNEPGEAADVRERYHRLVELSPDGILIHDGEHILLGNAAAMRLAGATNLDQLIGRPISDFLNPPYLKGVAERLVGNGSGGGWAPVPDTFRRLDGSDVQVEVTAIPYLDRGLPAAHLVIRDVTERLALQEAARLAEERLSKAQEMEAIGVLAGGVAHEVNNMMLVVLGASDFLLQDSTLPADRLRDLQDIRNAADRATKVTRQLLSFSQRAIHLPGPFDLDTLVHNLEQPMRRLLGDDRRLRLELGGPLGVQVDSGQIEQVLVNLALNARDAMPSPPGGTLTITTANAVVQQGQRGCAGTLIPAGRYGLIRVRDTGVGIDDATLLRLFEPFFTTKPVGEGTGLGLAAVYGILEQNRGFIAVDSTVGAGTTFTLYFPLLEDLPTSERSPSRPLQVAAGAGGGATILVVDDEPAVRRITGRILEKAGFRVKLGKDGAEALETVARDGPPDLVLTDLRMPGMSGAELASRLNADWPGLPVLFMSGYTADVLKREWGDDVKGSLIEKPFTPEELVRQVKALLSQAKVPH